MLYKANVTVCSQIHTKHINAMCHAEFWMLNLVVRIVTQNRSSQRIQFTTNIYLQ
jgi:hypothetical protein